MIILRHVPILTLLLPLILFVGCVRASNEVSIDAASKGDLTFSEKVAQPDGYDLAYGFSFELDFCGEPQLGQHVRAAILAKVDTCGFSEDVKMKFYKNANLTTQTMFANLIEYVEKNSATSGKLSDLPICENSNMVSNKIMLDKIKTKIQMYNNKIISLNELSPEVIPDCRQGASFSPNPTTLTH